MFSRLVTFVQLALAFRTAVGSGPVNGVDAPTVQLDGATVIGFTNDSVTSFLGIPFAEPPVGDLRLRLPKQLTSYNGTLDGTKTPAQCYQLSSGLRTDIPTDMLQAMMGYLTGITTDSPTQVQSEDCLSINVRVPEGTKPGDRLPVIAMIHGGGFTVGSNLLFAGDPVVRRSIELKQPVIFTAFNYRLSAFGFMGGKEVKEAGVGNLGLHDQREALRWIQKHIGAFGGDPERVTIWGGSAGSVSCGLQMLTNGGDTEGLFHGVLMSAGSAIPTGEITDVRMQDSYDTIVESAGCSNETDTLNCLRQLPAESLVAAAQNVPAALGYPGISTAWVPRADGVFLKAPPQQLVLSGSVAKIPFIIGDAFDEGTVFATGSFNVTTDDEFRDYLREFYLPGATDAELSKILELYPNDPTQGSPFETGDANELAPMFKRMAAFHGDVAFQAPRRFFLDHLSANQPTWSYSGRRLEFPGVGFAHGTDSITSLTEGNELTDYIVQFAATHDPNGGGSNRTIFWPRYNSVARPQLTMLEDDGIEIASDVERLEAMAGLSVASLVHPF